MWDHLDELRKTRNLCGDFLVYLIYLRTGVKISDTVKNHFLIKKPYLRSWGSETVNFVYLKNETIIIPKIFYEDCMRNKKKKHWIYQTSLMMGWI